MERLQGIDPFPSLKGYKEMFLTEGTTKTRFYGGISNNVETWQKTATGTGLTSETRDFIGKMTGLPAGSTVIQKQ